MPALASCAGPNISIPAASTLPDPCALATVADISATFDIGIKDVATPLVDDSTSRSCSILIHDINGDEHLVITDAANGAGAISTVCNAVLNTDIVTENLGTRACWNPGDVSVSAEQHGTFYSAAIIDPVVPNDYATPLEDLMTKILSTQQGTRQ